jgi:hypothetical protein
MLLSQVVLVCLHEVSGELADEDWRFGLALRELKKSEKP